MLPRVLLFTQLPIAGLIGALHLLGFQYFLYWRFWWYDMIIHSLGGIEVVLAVAWFVGLSRQSATWLSLLAAAIVVGIGWEAFELWGGIPREANWTFDTAIDLSMDALGGIIGISIVARLGRHLSV